MSKNKIEYSKEQIEYRDLKLEIKLDEENTEDNYMVNGYATTYNTPYHLYNDVAMDKNGNPVNIEVREQVSKSAFDNTALDDVIMQYDHQGRVFARTRNKTLTLNKDNDEGLYVEAYLGGTEIGKQLYEEIKGEYTTKMSFGFLVNRSKDTYELLDKGNGSEIWLRTINDITRVFDVSAVSLPANDFTSINARTSSGVRECIEAERLRVEEERKKAEDLAIRKANLETRLNMLKGE